MKSFLLQEDGSSERYLAHSLAIFSNNKKLYDGNLTLNIIMNSKKSRVLCSRLIEKQTIFFH